MALTAIQATTSTLPNPTTSLILHKEDLSILTHVSLDQFLSIFFDMPANFLSERGPQMTERFCKDPHYMQYVREYAKAITHETHQYQPFANLVNHVMPLCPTTSVVLCRNNPTILRRSVALSRSLPTTGKPRASAHPMPPRVLCPILYHCMNSFPFGPNTPCATTLLHLHPAIHILLPLNIGRALNRFSFGLIFPATRLVSLYLSGR
jgi:hypothetical protein